MRAILIFVIVLTFLLGCSHQEESKQSNNLDLRDIAEFAINKPLKSVIDSLQREPAELTIKYGSAGIDRSVRVTYTDKGIIELFFEDTSIISDSVPNKERSLNKFAGKIINEVRWMKANGGKGLVRNIKIY
jgi:hypothetical protein